jgi:hypothetical protein
MSQFRIRKIDTGLPDEWVPRTNDDGFQFGDDIVAEDPNDLAGAISETQTLLLKASVYAPSVLINPNSGVLERIKLIEDTVGSSTLQSAYESGNLINPAPGVPLILGPGGTIEIDSSGNLSFNPATMRILSGSSQFLNLSVNSINTSTNNLSIQTTGASRDLSLTAGNNLYLRDRFLLAPVTLSESGSTTLQTSSKSLVGAINEVRSGSVSAGLQQIYSQSFPAKIETSSTNGRLIIENKTGNTLTPALEILGNFVSSAEVKANTLVVGSGATTVNATGQISTSGNIITTAEVRTPILRSSSAALTLSDFFGSAALTSLADPSLLTEKQTIFGAINEVYTTGIANSTSLAAYAAQHNSTTGLHEIITTRASSGQNSTDRIIVQNDVGTSVTRVNALGEVRANNFILPTFNLLTETQANNTHRSGDGSDHSAVSSHISHPNPHNTVKSLQIGSTTLTGEVVLTQGSGITLTRSGQEVSISAAAGSTLSGVYNTEATSLGVVSVPLTAGLTLKDAANSQNVAVFSSSSTTFNKPVVLTAFSSISANNQLNVTSGSDFNIVTNSGNLNLTPAGSVNAKGIALVGTTAPVIPSYFQNDIVSTLINETAGNYIAFKNSTNETIRAGTPITLNSDRTLTSLPDAWTPISNAQIIAEDKRLASCFGVAIADVAPGQNGYAKSQGLVKANILQMANPLQGGIFQVNDTLYIADAGYATVEFKSAPASGDTVTIDGVTFTAGVGTTANRFFAIVPGNAAATLANFIAVVDANESRATYSGKALTAIADGLSAYADMMLLSNANVADTFRINASAIGGSDTTFTAVAAGTKTLETQFEVSTTKNGTVLNLYEAILNTNKVLSSGAVGHLCVPTLIGDAIRLKAREKGTSGNSIALATNASARIQTPVALTGGRLWARIFFMSRMSTGKTVSALAAAVTANRIAVTNFTAEESEFFYVSAPRMFADNRKTDFESKLIKVGKIVDTEGVYPTAISTIMVEIEDRDVHKA